MSETPCIQCDQRVLSTLNVDGSRCRIRPMA